MQLFQCLRQWLHKEQTDAAAENPDENIIDPEAAIADPADANAAPDSNDVIDLPAQPDVQPAADDK